MEKQRVVITGLGTINSIGATVKEFWPNVLSGKSGTSSITRFDTNQHKTKFANQVLGYNGLDYFDRKELRKLDLYSQFSLIAVEEAVVNSGIDFASFDPAEVGVIWSSGIGGFDTIQSELQSYFENNRTPQFNPFFIPKLLADSAAGLISIKYGLMGVNYSPVAACSSSTNALIEAFNYISWGKAQCVVAGGAEAPISEAAIGGFNSMKALSTRNEDYVKASRPFDKERDGFVAGEGAGALVLESLAHAQQRGANIIAEVVGGGASADAYHITNTHPEGKGAMLSMGKAIKEAGIEPAQVDHINAHATSTGPGDVSEMKAIEQLFASKKTPLYTTATKSMTGHLLGAAGAVEGIITALSVLNDEVPPIINTEEPGDFITKPVALVLGKSLKTKINYALSNTFGFGGHNASILLKKYL